MHVHGKHSYEQGRVLLSDNKAVLLKEGETVPDDAKWGTMLVYDDPCVHTKCVRCGAKEKWSSNCVARSVIKRKEPPTPPLKRPMRT